MTKIFKPPVEMGAYFVWISSIIFSLWNAPQNKLLLVPGIIGGVLLLFSVDYVKNKMDRYSISIIIVLSLLFLPYVLKTSIMNALFAIIYVLVLLVVSRGNSRLTRILGGGIIGFSGGLLSFPATKMFVIIVFPSIYAILGTVQASARVSGRTRIENIIETIVYFVLGAYAIWFFYMGFRIVSFIIFFDLAHRLILEATGYTYRIQIKKYGIIESVRSLVTNTVAGYYFHAAILAGLLVSG